VAPGFLRIDEEAGRFDDDIDAVLFPWEAGRILGADDVDVLAIHDEHIVLGFVGAGFLGTDFALEATLGGIVLEEVSEVVGWHDIADCDYLDVFADETLLDHRPEDEAADASKPVNSNFHWHISDFLEFPLGASRAGNVMCERGCVNEELGKMARESSTENTEEFHRGHRGRKK
jgi:hypothetical protein